MTDEKDKADLALLRWMFSMRYVVKYSSRGAPWQCNDCNGYLVGKGTSAISALQDAFDKWNDEATRAMWGGDAEATITS